MIHALHARLKDDSRFARVLKGGASGVAGKIAAVAVNAVSLPITVRYLGAEQYGFLGNDPAPQIMMLAVLDSGELPIRSPTVSRELMPSNRMRWRNATMPPHSGPRLLFTILLGLIGAPVIWPHIDWGKLFGLSLIQHWRKKRGNAPPSHLVTFFSPCRWGLPIK